MTDLVIRNCGQLITLAGPAPRAGSAQSELGIIVDGAVAITNGDIVAVGSDVEIEALADEATTVIDAGGCVVTPGLIDSHTHLVFGGSRCEEFEMRALGKSYAELLAAGLGIHSTVAATRAASAEDLRQAARARLDEMLAHGTTTVEAKSGYGLDLDTEIKQLQVTRDLNREHPIDLVPTFMGAHAVPPNMEPDAYVDFVCDVAIPAVAREGLARYCDVFCEQGVFTPMQSERILRTGQSYGLLAKIHADELCETNGAGLAADVGAVSADHLHCAADFGLRRMADAGTIAVLLPGTAVFLGMTHHAPARKMIDLGIPVAVATDFNPGSSPCVSLPLMMTLACTQLGLSPAEALVGVTVNAACAIGMQSRVGSLEVGKQADLVIWDAVDYRMIPYRMGSNLVRSVIKRGEVAY